jgi:threonine dehydrogenase-like Zn-dependent dehydrogenase
MRVVRQLEAGRLEAGEAAIPEPGPGELLIQVSACGICGSDLTSYKMGLFDGVPGHELAGVVESIGAGVEGWQRGQPVGIDPRLPCGECDQCRSGNLHRCVDSLTRRTVEPGGFAELVTAPLSVVRRLPRGLAPEIACLAEPLAVALHGIGQARLRPGEDAVVLGLGSIGMLAVAALKAAGAGRVYGVDPAEVRRGLATRLGADLVFESAQDARAGVEGTPVVLECSGRPESPGLAIDLAAQGGRVVLLGIPVAEITLVPVMWIIHEVSVTGCINSTADDYRQALRILAGEPGIGRIVTRRISLEEVPATFEALVRGSPADGKVVVDPRLPAGT